MKNNLLTNRQLVEHLKEGGVLKTPLLLDAFNTVDRANFVSEGFPGQIYADHPLPIGGRQTISQPSTVAFMLELLRPERGQKILDIGAGSGWTTALLAQIVGSKGKIIGLEILQPLAEFGQSNLKKYNFPQAEIRLGSGFSGFNSEAPFDRILVSAAATEVPTALKEQIKINGILVLPVKNSIYRLKRTGRARYQTQVYPGFAFVPLVGEQGSYGAGTY